ncbi:hypothetical protein [Streptomyces netropsis]|uniref:Helix-turn-helix domain-containing protein n=1 Tax=Streptomyces netropsis TaxID=55404 RepID=A0A7W7LAX6_STRNE|nr:hypothetical protein [Streptomyces netropsis]MBB4886258.1 hypothetical protein [Streptomyces netropsis]GGR15309.1 DNA-binding protein [Streptomyces netropsis]
MLKHASAPTRFFTQVSNEIIRHPRLSAEAVRLLTWQLSLPDSADVSLSETAHRAGIKKTAFIRAKRELIAEGYVHEWREQGARGRWVTVQLISDGPLTAEEAKASRKGARPTAPVPAVGEPTRPSVGRSQEKTTGAKTPHPPHPLAERGAQALVAVARGERRLRLAPRDIAQLAPLAAEWLLRGATLRELREALTSGLPDRINSPAGLTRDRLVRKMPEPPSFTDQRAATPAAPRVADMRECRGDHTHPCLFRPVDGETLCRACRQEQAEEAQDDTSGAIGAALRGGSLVRAALRGGQR